MSYFAPLQNELRQLHTRRHFLNRCTTGLGAAWLSALGGNGVASTTNVSPSLSADPLAPRPTHFAPRAKHVIYLHMEGAPSQFELFVNKAELSRLNNLECPQELLAGKRFAFIRGVPKLLGPAYPFHQAGDSGAWITDRLPYFERVIDKVCFIHTMQTEQFNHAPAQLLLHTGNANLGYASIGSWVTYGLGSENRDMPGYMVLISGGKFPSAGKAVWGSGFVPSVYQGVQCRSEGDPVLYLSNPDGISMPLRRRMIDSIERLNEHTYAELGDPETLTRISQYEMAYRMQIAAGNILSIADEPPEIHELYGTQPGAESFANNCLLARRLVERGVRYVQLFDWGWDSHGSSETEALDGPNGFNRKCREIDRPIYALLTDLERRGLLDETLVVWGGEFGRTPMRENRGGHEMMFKGRDHNPSAFTIWLAGGGVKRGFSFGETDVLGYEPTTRPVLVRDLHATILHLLGIDHRKLIYPFQGLNQKLTGVKPASVVEEILA
jgi:hypothetical protein